MTNAAASDFFFRPSKKAMMVHYLWWLVVVGLAAVAHGALDNDTFKWGKWATSFLVVMPTLMLLEVIVCYFLAKRGIETRPRHLRG